MVDGAALIDVVRRRLRESGRTAVAVAYSGGVDSRFLCHALLRAGLDVLALHARGAHVPEAESRLARRRAEEAGLALEEVTFRPLAEPGVRENGPRRCYFCKAALMRRLREALARREADGDAARLLCDGSNADDRKAWRPGLQALKEAGVVSPLAEAGFCKADVRAAGAASGMVDPLQLARPCLLTRFAYGVTPTEDALRRLADAEEALALLTDGNGQPLLGDFRVRLTPAPLIQAQHLPAACLPHLDAVMRRCGLAPWEFREEATISGLYDRKNVR